MHIDMAPGLEQKRHVGAAASFVTSKLAEGRVCFSLDELLRKTGLAKSPANYQLWRLPNVHRIVRRQDFFVIVRPEETVMGAPPATEWLDDYFKWLQRPYYYLGLLSAAAVHGSQPQAVQVVQVVSNFARRDIKVGRQTIRFYTKKHANRVPTQQVPGGRVLALVSTPEATVLDLLRYSGRIGGFDRAAETIQPLLPQLRAAELKKALDAEGEPALAQRLGYILESANKTSLVPTVLRWLPSAPPWAPLEPGPNVKQQQWPMITKWRLIKNTAIL